MPESRWKLKKKYISNKKHTFLLLILLGLPKMSNILHWFYHPPRVSWDLWVKTEFQPVTFSFSGAAWDKPLHHQHHYKLSFQLCAWPALHRFLASQVYSRACFGNRIDPNDIFYVKAFATEVVWVLMVAFYRDLMNLSPYSVAEIGSGFWGIVDLEGRSR